MMTFVYLLINQAFLNATYTMTSGQLNTVLVQTKKVQMSNNMICRIKQISFQFLFEKLGVN